MIKIKGEKMQEKKVMIRLVLLTIISFAIGLGVGWLIFNGFEKTGQGYVGYGNDFLWQSCDNACTNKCNASFVPYANARECWKACMYGCYFGTLGID